MSVSNLFHFNEIGPGQKVGLFVHGYTELDFSAYAIIPSLHANVPPAAVTVTAQLSEGPTSRHVDGTVARTIFIENQSVGPQPYISADVLEFKESA